MSAKRARRIGKKKKGMGFKFRVHSNSSSNAWIQANFLSFLNLNSLWNPNNMSRNYEYVLLQSWILLCNLFLLYSSASQWMEASSALWFKSKPRNHPWCSFCPSTHETQSKKITSSVHSVFCISTWAFYPNHHLLI